MDYVFYTHAEVTIHAGPDMCALTYKSQCGPPVTVTAANDIFTFQTGVFDIRQDLAHAPADFDPRSQAAITLEALEAKIAGRALTIQQSKVTIGDRSIDYMNSIEELLKWRDYFARIVAKEEGRGAPKVQVCHLRRK